MTGWFVVYRCGCFDFQGTADQLKDTCPKHGGEQLAKPAVVTAKPGVEYGFTEDDAAVPA